MVLYKLCISNKKIYEEMRSFNELNQENVENFLNEYFHDNMEKWNVPGVAVTVINDGKELYKVG